MSINTVTLSVIIVNWNTSELLRQCLTSLYGNLPLEPIEIIVVDNGSSDESVEMIKNNFPDVVLIRNKDNLGFAKANNQGMKISKGKYLALLNTDTQIDHDVFGQLINYLEHNSATGIVGPRLKNSDGSLQFSFGHLPSLWGIFAQQGLPLHAIPLLKRFLPTLLDTNKNQYNYTHKVGWVKGACFVIRRKVYEKIGGLDEKVFMYMEEVEYCKRAWDCNYEVNYYADVSVWHLERGSSKDGKRGSILGIYKGIYNYYKTHKPKWQLYAVTGILRFGAIIRLMKDYKTYSEALRITN